MALGPPITDGDMAAGGGDAESGAALMKSNSDGQMQLKRIKIDGSQTRWIVISLVVYSFLAEGFSKTCFSQIKDTTARLFQVSTETVGWLDLAPTISCVVAAFFMSWAAACRFVGLRKWCLTAALFITLAFVFVVVASLNGNTIGLAFLGQAFSGAANAINFCLVPLIVGSWFPENEQVTAIALTFSGLNSGNIVGFLVPEKILPELDERDAVVATMGSVIYQNGKEIQPEPITWAEQVSISLTAIFASFLAASVLFGFFSFLFIFDSPTPMQLVTPVEENNQIPHTYLTDDETAVLAQKSSAFQVQFARARNVTKSTFVTWYQISKSLLTMRKFVLPAIPYSIIISLCLMWFTIMPDMVESSHFIKKSSENATSVSEKGDFNWIAGRVLSTYAAGGVLAGIVTGKMTQLFNYRLANTACIGTWCVVVCSVGICLGFVTTSLATVYIFMLLFGFFAITASTSLVAFIVKHATTSENRFSVGAWLTFLQSIAACMLPLLAQTLFENTGPMSIHVFQIILSLFSALFLLFALRFLR